jgi:hypothetical protein
MISPQALALGVGRVANNTALGQPLDFTAVLRLDADETITPDCVFADVMLGDRVLPAQAVRVLLGGEAGSVERRVRITTIPIVDEPIVSITLRVGCPMRFSRNFVAFVDPPAVNLAQAAPEPAAPAATEPATTPGPGAASTAAAPSGAATPDAGTPPDAPVAAAQRPVQAPARRVDRNVQRPPVAPETRTAPAPRIAQARPAPGGPRLRLDPAAPIAPQPARPAAPPTDGSTAVAPPGETTTAAPEAAAEAAEPAAAAAAAARAAEEAALRALEQSLTALRNEALSTQKSVAVLQARLAAAEAQRYQNWLVYTLAAGVVLLAIALMLTVSRLRNARRETGWWAPSAQSAGAPAEAPEPVRAPEVTMVGAMTASPMSTQPAAATALGVSATTSMPYVAPMSDAPKTGVSSGTPPAEGRREVTVEELIDLEQQAEFFIVLGQDDAAIDVLMGHLRSTGGASPLPYLKLLEIYRRRGDRDAYERIRDRFNRRFNAYAPEWGADLQQGRTLEDYPAVLGRLQSQWKDPSEAMQTLEASLLREHESAETFDLPAYREILFLYSLARDLAEHEVPDTVDLLLPIGDEPPAAAERSGVGAARRAAAAPAPEGPSERSERYDVDFQFGSGASFTGTSSRTGDKSRKR